MAAMAGQHINSAFVVRRVPQPKCTCTAAWRGSGAKDDIEFSE